MDMRFHFNAPVDVTGPNRCAKHNAAEGGAPASQHLLAKAADVKVSGIHADSVADYLEETYPDRYGIGRYNDRTHIDVRSTRARWDKR
jgi:uncharacterized protein YcbK (DUF882 family)